MSGLDCLAGGGEAGALLRAIDWSKTSLGLVQDWPISLRAAVRIVLSSEFPMMLHWGPELTTIYNDAYAPSLGHKHPGNLGRPAREWWSEMWDQLGPIFDKVLLGGTFHVENARYTPNRNGTPQEAYFTHCHSPVWDDEGRIAGIFLVVTETTRQVAAERDLTQANADLVRQAKVASGIEARLSALVRASSEALYSMSADWTEMRQLTGGGFLADTGTANPHWIEDYIPEEEQSRVWAAIEEAIRSRSVFSLEHQVRLADGGVGWTLSRAVPLFGPDGEITEWFGTASDITARLEIEEARRRLNELLERQVAERTAELTLYRNIVQSTRFPICAYDTEQRVTIFNKAHASEWLRVMGYRASSGEVLPDAFPPPQAAAQRAFADRALAGDEFTVEGRFGDPNLTVPHWELDYAPIRDEEGHIIGAFHHARDVTSRLKAEADLQQAQDALRHSQKMELVGQLTGGVAHDFNNLLTVIRSSVDLLKRPGLSEERRDRYIAAISNTVERAARITNQLLAFARRQALKPEVFAACDSVRMLSDMLGTLTGSRIVIVTELPEARCFVNADPSQFDTALVNIAVNARDAMDGEGRLTVRVQAVEELPAVRLHSVRSGAFVAVSVTDTGSGIPLEQMERIFEPFFTTKEQGKGTGLGLSQVFGFAKQSGGEVTVESRVGEGTTFTLYLPRVTAAENGPAEASEPALLVDGHGTCVLVVEDNADVGAFATQTLTELGYHVVLASDAAAALAELVRDADRFDVVFSDVVMPGMSGIELGQRIRQDHHDLPVVLTSGYSHVLAQNGTYGFELLHKPYSIEQLSRVLRKAATWQRQRRMLNR